MSDVLIALLSIAWISLMMTLGNIIGTPAKVEK